MQSVKHSSLDNLQFPLKVNHLCSNEAVRDLKTRDFQPFLSHAPH